MQRAPPGVHQRHRRVQGEGRVRDLCLRGEQRVRHEVSGDFTSLSTAVIMIMA